MSCEFCEKLMSLLEDKDRENCPHFDDSKSMRIRLLSSMDVIVDNLVKLSCQEK